jgi:hypothetical protein
MLDHTSGTAVRLRHWAAVLGLALMPLAPTPELRAQAHGQPHPPEHSDTSALKVPADSTAVMKDAVAMSGAPAMPMLPRPLGIPMTRMGSGTSWLPDDSPMRAYHFMPDGWTLMAHGDVDLYYTHQGTVRGDDQVGSTSWVMVMAMRRLGSGMLHLHGMLSAEPLTVGARGYPLLLQTGEVYQGAPLVDRQHPHDLFMELSARYEVPVSRHLGVSLFAAPVGEPAIGPVAYMHRPSAQDDPFAPLVHHWQDATHITFGVLTAGVFTRTIQLEGTLFQGREPDDDRYDFDFGALDSYGGRLTVNPGPHWSLAASYGYLESPEALHPEENQHRLGASVLYAGNLGRHGVWAGALIYGANKHTMPGEPSREFQHSLLLEGDGQLDERNSVFGRIEWVEKSAEELVVPDVLPDEVFDIAGLTLGYVREVASYAGASLGLGVRVSIDVVPETLESTYGTRRPAGLVLYARLRPAMLHFPEAYEEPDRGMPHEHGMPEHHQHP